jgi:hypothetical protein
MVRRLAIGAIFVAAFCSAASAGGADSLRASASCHFFAEDPCLANPLGHTRTAARTFAAATTEGSVLRGLGLPSLSGVDGASLPDDKLELNEDVLSVFTKPFPPPRKTSSAGGGAQTSPFSKTFTAPVDGVGAALGVKQRIAGSTVRWLRNVQVGVSVGQCPEMKGEQNTHGSIEMNLRGSYGLTGIWQQGGAEIERGVLITIDELRSHGAVDRNAKFAFWQAKGLDVRVTTSTVVRRPGQKARHKQVTGTFHAKPAERGWQIGPDAFDDWIARENALMPHEPVPGTEGPLLSKEAYAKVIRPFLELAEGLLMRSVAEAERGWRTPNKCARIDWEPESGRLAMSPGETKEIRARIVRLGGGLDGLSKWQTDPRELVGKVDAYGPGSQHGQPMRIVVKAAKPKQSGGYTVHIRWRVPSTIGVVESEWTTLGAGLPRRWVGTFEGVGTGEPDRDFKGKVEFVRSERYSSDVSVVYLIESASLTVTSTWDDCEPATKLTDNVTVGRLKHTQAKLEIYILKRPGKGHWYTVDAGFEGPERKYKNPCRDPRVEPEYIPYHPGAGFSSQHWDLFTNGSTIKGSSWLKGNKFGETWELHGLG